MALKAIFGDLSDDRTIGGSSAVGTTNITNVSATASAVAGRSPTVSATLSDTSLSFAFGLVPGEQGEPGITSASASAQSLAEGSAATAQATLTGQALALDFGIPKGDTGNGISGITLISTVGKVKTYRITMTDGSTFDFQITDGADGTGAGDMTKATYDTDDDGLVDAVEDTLNPGTGIEFSLDSAGKGQYRATGASQWIPFLSGPEYTRLWTNSSPTSSFGAQTINLSEAANTYDAIRIVYAYNTGSGVTADNWEGQTDAVSQMYELGSAPLDHASGGYLQIGITMTATNSFARRGYFNNSYAGIYFSACTRIGSSGNSNTNCVPILVDGVKF